MKIEHVPTVHCRVGERPVWDVAEQALYFFDIVGKTVPWRCVNGMFGGGDMFVIPELGATGLAESRYAG